MRFAADIREALRIGQASAQANLVSLVVLWALAGVSVGAYYLFNPFRELLEPVVEWHREYGWWAAAFDAALKFGQDSD